MRQPQGLLDDDFIERKTDAISQWGMSKICAEPLCHIHEHLSPEEADRVRRLLARIRWGLLPVEQVPLIEEDAVLRHCPYMKAAGPSRLCAEHCHLHHLVFAESWP